MAVRNLAAVVYEAGQGSIADALLVALAERLKAEGRRVAGAVQRSRQRIDRSRCDMIVRDLATDTERLLSEDRGPMARGCRLSTTVLEELVGSTLSVLSSSIDVLIVNKFGKQEELGAGFRESIARAVADGVPTIVGVNRQFHDDWHAFSGDLAEELPPTQDAIDAWLLARSDTSL
jgi:nucleoside-triphosphatase THEP1